MDAKDEASDKEDNPSMFESIAENLEKAGEEREVDIMTVKIGCDTKKSKIFEGACADSGAQLSVIGERKADLYC